tara:strand:- start:1120 stop:1782 length:663 start_codon:yes stop_codon:yes gene_type:complete
MKVEINVPDSLSEIKLEQYRKFQALNTDENSESPFLLQKMIEIFCNLNLKEVATIKYKSVQVIVEHLNKVFSVKTDLKNTFKLKGVEYGFIPVLDDMSLGEYIDLDNYIGDWNNMHKAMNVLFRPIENKRGGKYNIIEYGKQDNSEVLKDMPLDIVLGAMVFFYHLNNELLTITLSYLEEEMHQEMTLEQRQTLERSGLGINQSMDYLRAILPDTIRLQP